MYSHFSHSFEVWSLKFDVQVFKFKTFHIKHQTRNIKQ